MELSVNGKLWAQQQMLGKTPEQKQGPLWCPTALGGVAGKTDLGNTKTRIGNTKVSPGNLRGGLGNTKVELALKYVSSVPPSPPGSFLKRVRKTGSTVEGGRRGSH